MQYYKKYIHLTVISLTNA